MNCLFCKCAPRRHFLFLFLAAAPFAFATASYAESKNSTRTTSTQCPTPQGQLNGYRQSCRAPVKCISAEEGTWLRLRSLRVTSETNSQASEYACATRILGVSEVIAGTGFLEPKTICLNGWVKNLGGAVHIGPGSVATLTCQLSIDQVLEP